MVALKTPLRCRCCDAAGHRRERPMPFTLRSQYSETPKRDQTRRDGARWDETPPNVVGSERRGRGDVRQPLEALDVRRRLHDTGGEGDELQVALGVDPEDRLARVVVAQSP